MSPGRYLLHFITPDGSRWKPMLMGLAVCAAVAGAAVAFEPPRLLEALLVIVALAAWLAGACAMVGYVRWFVQSELGRAQQDADRENRTGDKR